MTEINAAYDPFNNPHKNQRQQAQSGPTGGGAGYADPFSG